MYGAGGGRKSINQAQKTQKIVWHYYQHIKLLAAPEDFAWLLWDLSHIADKAAVKKIKQLIWQRAQAVGLDYNKKAKKFISTVRE